MTANVHLFRNTFELFEKRVKRCQSNTDVPVDKEIFFSVIFNEETVISNLHTKKTLLTSRPVRTVEVITHEIIEKIIELCWRTADRKWVRIVTLISTECWRTRWTPKKAKTSFCSSIVCLYSFLYAKRITFNDYAKLTMVSTIKILRAFKRVGKKKTTLSGEQIASTVAAAKITEVIFDCFSIHLIF